MCKNYFFWEVEVLCVYLFDALILFITVELVFKEIKNVNCLFVIFKLTRVDPEKYLSHNIIANERVIAIACQIKVALRIVLDYLLVLTVISRLRLI